MSTRTAAYREAVDHLPTGATLVLPDVSWDEYEELLEDLADRPAVRLTYDQGRVEIMSPTSREHEKYKEFIGALIAVVAEDLNLALESSGSTTWKQRQLEKGAEPDLSFHIANADRVIGKDELDLDVDPPPDLVVEIDVTNESLGKLAIYAAFRVPEVWRYLAKQKRLVLYELRQSGYVEVPRSRSFPLLTADVLTAAIQDSRLQGHSTALRAFRRRITGD